MSPSIAEFPIEALMVDERLTLLGILWDSLLDAGPPPFPAWHLDEIRRRVAAIDADPTASITLEELRREFKTSGS